MAKARDYREQWATLGYPSGMGSATFLPPPSSQFVRAYQLLPARFAECNITRRRLKVSRFADVNDPFELLGLNCHDPKVRKLTRSFVEQQNARTGLLCFTADWTNPVLWSHYADRHKGICLGFDLRRRNIEFVEYSDRRLRQAFSDEHDPRVVPEDLRGQLCRTKSRHWEYEQELRILVPLVKAVSENASLFWPFHNNMRLAEVILGPRCDHLIDDVKRIVAASGSEAAVFKARLAFRSFRVVLDGRTRPPAA